MTFNVEKAFKDLKNSTPRSMNFPLKELKSYITRNKGNDYQNIKEMASVSAIINNAYLESDHKNNRVNPLQLFVILTNEEGEPARFPPVPPHFRSYIADQPDEQTQYAFNEFEKYFNSQYSCDYEGKHVLWLLEHLCRWSLNEEVGVELLPIDSSLKISKK